jgi:rhodanese-related sulfurtransferase
MLARLLCFFVLVLSAPAFADEGAAPIVFEGGRVVTVEEAKAWFDSGNVLFVDVRNPINYGRGHIPSAVAVPYEYDQDKAAFLKELPAGKDAPIIIYSHGETGWKSYHASTAAVKAGYRNVMWMREGFDGWTSRRFAVFTGRERTR